MRRFILVLSIATLGACSAERRPDIPSQNVFPPVGLASTAVWLEERRAPAPRRLQASDIPTEDLCDIVDDCISFLDSAAR